MTQPILHIDFISLAAGTTLAARKNLLTQAGELRGLDGLNLAGAIEADTVGAFDLAIFFLLENFGALEPFGTDIRYTRFLQRQAAPLLKGFAGADVSLTDESFQPSAFAACQAMEALEETYDWEIAQQLQTWLAGMGKDVNGVIGLAVGERQRFRGLGLAFAPAPILTKPLAATQGILISGRVHLL